MERKNKIGRTWEKFSDSPFFIIYDKWQDCAVRSAALSYYTLAGLISFCVFELWICKVLDIHSYVEGAISTIFGEFGHEALGLAAMNRLMNIKQTWAGGALIVILISVICTIDNLSAVFDRMMLTDKRVPLAERLGKSLLKGFITTLIIMVGAYLICIIPQQFMKYLALGISVFILLFLALKFLPAESPFNWKNAIYASAVSALAVISSFQILRVIYSYLIGPFVVLFILVWLYFSWLAILIVMLFFSNISTDGRHYYYKETENISGMFKTYLSIIAASYVFKNWKENVGCSFEDIRAHALTDKFSFPSSTLNRILKKLVKKDILETDKNFKYLPHKSLRTGPVEDMTVGDLLFELQFRGEYDLSDDISYQSLNVQLSSDLDSYLMQSGHFSSLTQKLSEINFGFDESSGSCGFQTEQWGYDAKKKSYAFIKHPFEVMQEGALFEKAFENDKEELKRQMEQWPEPDRSKGLEEWQRLERKANPDLIDRLRTHLKK